MWDWLLWDNKPKLSNLNCRKYNGDNVLSFAKNFVNYINYVTDGEKIAEWEIDFVLSFLCRIKEEDKVFIDTLEWLMGEYWNAREVFNELYCLAEIAHIIPDNFKKWAIEELKYWVLTLCWFYSRIFPSIVLEILNWEEVIYTSDDTE
jgi:hypothetical protein